LEEGVKKAIELLSEEETVKWILGLLATGAIGYAIERILRQYLKTPLILKTRWLKHKGKAHEYSGKRLMSDFWQDLLGDEYGLFPGADKIIEAHHFVTFKDVVVTDFVPRAPGFYYSKTLWNNPKLAPLSLGVIRVIPNEQTGSKRLLAIHKPSEFEAHWDMEKGVPIVVSREVYEKLGDDLQKTGVAHVQRITAIMSDVGDYSRELRMADIPSTFPVVREERFVKKGGDPVPIMGNAWVVYKTPKTSGFLNFRFWAGVDYHRDNLREAKKKLEKLIPPGGFALTDFDDKVRHWVDAPLRLSDAWKYLGLLGKKITTQRVKNLSDRAP